MDVKRVDPVRIKKSLSGRRVIHKTTRFLIALLGVLFGTASAKAQNSNGNWISGLPADKLWNQMAQMPYAQNGNHGLTIYMLSYSSCGNCIVFLRDFWEARKKDIQLREFFAPINQPELLNEAADIALTRNAEAADAYYHRSRVAPSAKGSPERQAALDKAEVAMTQANAFFRSIGHIQDGFPTFVFRVNDAGKDKVWIISGFGPDVARDMDRYVKQASQN